MLKNGKTPGRTPFLSRVATGPVTSSTRLGPRNRDVRAPLLVFLLCAVAIGLNFALAPDAYSTELILISLSLCVFVALGLRFPRLATLLFLVTFTLAIFSGVEEFPAFIFLAPVFCGVIAFAGELPPTIAVTLGTLALGLLDPDVESPGGLVTSIDPSALLMWSILLLIGSFSGWAFGLQERRRHQLAADWQRELKQRRQELATTLHDSVTGPLTSVVLRSETMRLQLDAETDEGTSNELLDKESLRNNLETIADSSREAMVQSRKLLDLLQSTDWALSSGEAPAVADSLEEFRERISQHGFRVFFTLGVPPDAMLPHLHTPSTSPPSTLSPADTDAFPNGISQKEYARNLPQGMRQRTLIHRLLLEGATNIIKYAEPGSPIIVSIDKETKPHTVGIWNLAKEGAGESENQSSLMSSKLGLVSLRRWASRARGTIEIRHKKCGPHSVWCLSASFR